MLKGILTRGVAGSNLCADISEDGVEEAFSGYVNMKLEPDET